MRFAFFECGHAKAVYMLRRGDQNRVESVPGMHVESAGYMTRLHAFELWANVNCVSAVSAT